MQGQPERQGLGYTHYMGAKGSAEAHRLRGPASVGSASVGHRPLATHPAQDSPGASHQRK